MARQDPWLSERMRADARIRRGERNIYNAVITAMTVWLDTTRALILGQPVPALTAAADDPIPDIDAAQASFAAWARALENHVEPAIAEAFGEAFAAQSRAADISPVHFQEHHMATVHDRLKIWPEGAFEELRPELLEAMQQNESIEQITDRIGRILDIDAPSRRIRADISAIDAQIADPTTDRDELPFLRGKRRRLWNQHDESQQQWKWLARRIARTEIQGAVEGGSLASAQATEEATGEEMYKAWLCVTGDTPVSAVGVTHASRRHYEGPAVRIRTASGATVSLTPEHRVLTGRGWIPAKLVNEKDHLLHVVSTDPAIAPDVQEVPATIGEVVDAFMATEPVEVWSMPTGVDLDSELVYSQVEVVRPDRDLANSLHPRVGEFSEDLVFADADLLAELMLLGDRSSLDGTSGFDLASVLHRDSETARRFDRIRFVGDTDLSGLGHVAQSNSGLIQDAPDGRLGTGQCGCDVPCGSSSSVKPDSLRGEIASSPLFLSGLSCSSDVDRLHGAEFAGFRAGSSFTHGSDFASDGVHAASNVVGDRLTGLAGSVAADDVVNVELYTFSGHVYDLSTTGEWYACDGLIIHNCTSDDRTRASHNVADGQIVKLAEPFRVGVALLPHPAFPGGPAHEVIRCRCSMRILTYSEMQAELQGMWGGRGVSPMGARLGPDDEADAATAIDRLNRERRGEVLESIERTEPEIQDTVNVDDDVQENPEILEPDDEPFTTPHDDLPDLEDDIPDDELHVADEEPDLDTDDEEVPDQPAVEGDPADDSDNETEPEVHQPDTDPADIPEVEEEPAPPPAPTESVILEPIIETTPTPEPLVFGDLEVDDARRWASRSWPLDRNSFDPEVSGAVTQYTGDFHDVMNESLRGEFLAETSEANQRMVANLRRAIDEAPRVPEPVHAFREVSRFDAFQLSDEDSFAALLGEAFTDLGFMSTSLTQATAGAADLSTDTVMVEIAVPAGYAAIYVSGTTSQQADSILSAFGNAEVELILKDGTTIVITGIEFDTRGRPILQAEVIDVMEGE